ncbi:MAG: NAD(+) synthase, partial [Muribaculaceae bacterium]|nr:NAD(+) synthase [Muribaculaceae bacterium]
MNQQGFFRVAAVTPQVNVGDCNANVKIISDLAHELDCKGVELAVFPEMSVTGYTCADLFHNFTLTEAATQGLRSIAHATSGLHITIIVGVPLTVGSTVYNCAAVIHNGRILAAIPKTYIPNYNEFYEKRWWASGNGVDTTSDQGIRICRNLIIETGGVKIGFDICEDLWAPVPPSTAAALNGAQVIVNLSASNDLIGKYAYLTSL